MHGRAWVPWALCALAGVLAWLGFAGMDLWPLALVAFVPFFVALERSREPTARRIVLLGALFGSVGWTGGYSWLLGTLRDFSGFPLVACLALAALFWVYQGGQFALFGWLWWRARRRGAGAALAAATSFAATELLYPQLFPSYYAASFHAVPLLIQTADIGGPILVSALCLSVNGAVYGLLRRSRDRAWRGPLVVAGCVAAALVYGAIRIAQIDAAAVRAEKLSVGIVQPNMEQHAKWKDFREGLRRLVAGTRELEERHRPRLIVWPETAYVRPLPLELRRLPEEVAGSIRTPLVLGSMARGRLGGGRREFNRVLLADEGGEIRGTYDKVNLVAFSEAMPFDDRLPWLRDVFPAGGRLTPGDHVRPLVLDGWRISALVCYEDVLPRFVRRVVREASPHLLVNFTNDAWFGDTLQPWMHLALAKFRAVEHRRYLVRATNTGVSAVVDPAGRVVVRSGAFTRENLHAEVAMLQGWTPYQSLGDWPGWLGLAAIAWLGFGRRVTTSRER